jgi:hypothetical protein
LDSPFLNFQEEIMSSKKHPVVTEETYPTSNGTPGENNPATFDYDNNTNQDYKTGEAEGGARQPKGKSSACDAVLRTGLQPTQTEAVRNAKEDVGAHKRCSEQQSGENGSPKKRIFEGDLKVHGKK